MIRLATILLLLCAGCGSVPSSKLQVPSSAAAKSPLGQKLAALMPPAVESRAQGSAVAPYVKTITLEWDNPNPDSPEWPLKYCLTEFHSTGDVMQPFKFKAYVSPLTNRVTFTKTNAQEFYICRFVWTNVTPWFATSWNTR